MRIEEFKEIVYGKEDSGIVTVTLNIPKRKNAISPYTLYELFWAVDAMEKDEAARVMILTGAKDPDNDDPAKEAFCSGGYFNPNAMAGVSDEIKADIRARLINLPAALEIGQPISHRIDHMLSGVRSTRARLVIISET